MYAVCSFCFLICGYIFLQESSAHNSTFVHLPALQNGTPLTQQQSSSSSKIFPKQGSTSPPMHRPPSGRKRRDHPHTGHEKKTSQSSKVADNALVRNLRDMVPASFQFPSGPNQKLSQIAPKHTQRHQSLPNSVINGETLTQNRHWKKGNVCPPIAEGCVSANSTGVSGLLNSTQPQTGADLAKTWPRSVRPPGDHTGKTEPVKAHRAGEQMYNVCRSFVQCCKTLLYIRACFPLCQNHFPSIYHFIFKTVLKQNDNVTGLFI